MDKALIHRISVLMPVYNCRQYIKESVDSILNQTYNDYEFLIIDDCSTDGTLEYLETLSDSRIQIIKKPKNTGLIASLNLGLQLAKGKYIARMDGDDISLPTRFEKQLALMEANPDVVVCATSMELFGEGNKTVWAPPIKDSLIRASHLFYSCIYHPTSMLRVDTIKAKGLLYDALYKHTEDYDLWIRLADYGKLANIQEVLLNYRRHSNSVTTANSEIQHQNANRIRKRILSEKLKADFTEIQFQIHEAFSYWDIEYLKRHKKQALAWLKYLEQCNIRTGYTSSEAMREITDNFRKWLKNMNYYFRLRHLFIRILRKILKL
jgi:glycosyltransferase involved in cell wall biosynthesis